MERIDPAAVYPTLKEISDADSFVAARSADCSDRAPLPSQRHLVADGMANDRRNALRLAASQPCGDRIGCSCVPQLPASAGNGCKLSVAPIHIAMPKLCLGTTGLFSTKIDG